MKISIFISALTILLLSTSTSYARSNINQDCTFRGIPLYGNVKVVSSFADFKVKIVNSFADLNVKTVESFPNSCGEWKFVESFPDFTITFVNSFPDFTIKNVNSFPGIN